MCTALETCETIFKLTLNLNWNQLTINGVNDLAEAIKANGVLDVLYLNLKSFSVNKKEEMLLVRAIKGSANINTACLNGVYIKGEQ